MGVAWLRPGEKKPECATWRFKARGAGECYLEFLERLGELLKVLPDVQIAIELMTVVTHDGHVDAKQVQLSSGWFNALDMMRARRGLREIEQTPIQSWRSKSHGKVKAPKEIKEQNERRKYLKQAAIDFCEGNGWPVANDEEAEALCILEWLRIEYEPGYSFSAGHGGHQQAMAL